MNLNGFIGRSWEIFFFFSSWRLGVLVVLTLEKDSFSSRELSKRCKTGWEEERRLDRYLVVF